MVYIHAREAPLEPVAEQRQFLFSQIRNIYFFLFVSNPNIIANCTCLEASEST